MLPTVNALQFLNKSSHYCILDRNRLSSECLQQVYISNLYLNHCHFYLQKQNKFVSLNINFQTMVFSVLKIFVSSSTVISLIHLVSLSSAISPSQPIKKKKTIVTKIISTKYTPNTVTK